VFTVRAKGRMCLGRKESKVDDFNINLRDCLFEITLSANLFNETTEGYCASYKKFGFFCITPLFGFNEEAMNRERRGGPCQSDVLMWTHIK